MRFSERNGFVSVSTDILKNDVNEILRNTIWNLLYYFKFSSKGFANSGYTIDSSNNNQGVNSIGKFSAILWMNYFKIPLDERPSSCDGVIGAIKRHFFECSWFIFYDFLEFVLIYFQDEEFNQNVNIHLEKELSGYRFINGIITEITDKQEIEMLENVLTEEDFPNVKAHLQRALELLSDRKNPDYRNSIKESISAVESIAKEIAQKPKAELAEALKEIEKNGELHGALKKGFLSLYGYTSDANGIRHSLMEESNLSADDAKFFLLVCTSFINYLKTKI